MNRQREQDIITLCADWSKREEDAVISAAIEIWQSRCYVTRSQKSQPHLRAHKRRLKRAGAKPTICEFGSARRREAGLAARNATSPIVSKRKLRELTADAWTPSMHKEESHMKKKRATRLIEVTAAGGGSAPGLLRGFSRAEIVDLYTADQARLAKDRMRKHRRKQLVFTPRKAHALRGKSIKFEPALAAACCTAVMSELRLKAVADLGECDIVCANLDDISPITKLHVYLNGGAIAQPEYLNSHGSSGSYIALRPSVHAQRREIWTSASFAVSNPRALQCLTDAMASEGSKWTWFAGSNKEFLCRALRVKSLCGLVTEAEFAAFPKGFANALTLNRFLHTIIVINADKLQV